MPLSTWLAGSFRISWGPDGEGVEPAGRRRSPEVVQQALEAFGDQMEKLLAFRPACDGQGAVQSATVFSLDGFSLPFLLARQWGYRLKLPRLGALEASQIWMPEEFEPAIRLAPPWNPESELGVASSPRLCDELARLLAAIESEDRPDLLETHRVTERLHAIAARGLEHDLPVIVES
jgi:hypothetical protein